MDARAFEAALTSFGDNASCRRLYELMTAVATGSYGKGVLGPSVAEAYLDAFTHRTLPNRNRRWVGLVLYQLIESSNDVLEHLRSLSKEVRLLSNVILNEPEDLKMVAGIIIRTMILGGMQYADFWSNGAPYSVPFPTDETQVWMQDFQGFMDELHRLKFLEDDGEAGIIFALSISAKDTHDFIRETGAMVLFFDSRYLTAFVLGTAGRIPQVIDVPISHIVDTDTRTAIIRNSDDDTSGLETGQLVISLRPLPWTYLFNAEERDAKQMTITLDNMADALEAQSIIQEIQRHKAKKKMSISQVSLDISQTPQQGETSDAEVPAAEKPANEEPAINPVAEELSVIPESYPLYAADANETQGQDPDISGAESSANQEQENLKEQHNAAESPSGRHASQDNVGSNEKEHSVTESPRGTPVGVNQDAPDETVPAALAKAVDLLAMVTKSMPEASVRTGKLKKPTLGDPASPAKKNHHEASVFDVPDTPPRAFKARLKKTITYHKKPAKDAAKPKTTRIPMKSVVPKKKAPPRGLKSKPVPPKKNAQPAKENHNSNNIAPESSEPSSDKVKTKPSTSKANEKTQDRAGGATPSKSTLPKRKPTALSRATDKAAPSEADLTIYDIPPDEPEKAGKLKRPVRRSVAKVFNYNVEEESGYRNEESEYANQGPTQESTQEAPPNPKKRKLQEPPKTTVAGPGKKRKSNNQIPIPASESGKKGLAGRLVGISPPVTAAKSTPITEKQASLVVGNDGSQSDDFMPLIASSPPVSQASPTQSKAVDHAHGKKRPAETPPVETPKAKRNKLLESSQRLESTKTQRSVRSRTHSSQVHVNEAGSPCAADTEERSGKTLLDGLRNRTTSEWSTNSRPGKRRGSESPTREHNNALSKAAFIVISDNKGEAVESDYGSSSEADEPSSQQVFSSNTKPAPASPNAASQALSGYADEEELRTIGVRAEEANAASDPFNPRHRAYAKGRNENFTRRLSGQNPYATPVPPLRKKAMPRKPLSERVAEKSLGELAVPHLEKTMEVLFTTEVVKLAQKVEAIVQAPTTPAFAHGTENEFSSYQPLVEPRKTLGVQIAQGFKIPPKPTIQPLSTPTPTNDPNLNHNIDESDTYANDNDENDPDQTLVEPHGSMSLPTKSLAPDPPSSPPVRARSQSITSVRSLHSSSSFVETAQQVQVQEEEAEEMEWEAALQPHQRAVSDALLRLSKRFIRHLVDSETALSDIVAEYERDGREVINRFVKSHKSDHNEMIVRAETQKRKQVDELKGFAKKLTKARMEFEG
ncbi:hypothetical protein BU16DRAFT_558138 [Lophium mytilinum]|uniref:Uncharacterized protein n=1 Tax=Lophium mytilinum TaxID=390894 RepID=A0A6A6R7L5_9PEZI|nr:hypothetical protein BU16DRAFT_558138 [Lophium mytilinum]